MTRPGDETDAVDPVTIHDLRRDTRDLGEVVRSIEAGVQSILTRLAKGDTALALLEHRVAFLERLVYGVIAIIGTAFVGAVVALVIKVQG